MPLKKFALATSQLTDSKKLNENINIAKKIFNSCVNFPEITGGTKSINCILTKNNDIRREYKGKTVYLSNYDEDFFKIKDKYNVDEIICLEPYYS